MLSLGCEYHVPVITLLHLQLTVSRVSSGGLAKGIIETPLSFFFKMYLFSTLFLFTMLVLHAKNVFEQANLQTETTT